MPHTYILIQDVFLASGFLEGFRSKGAQSQYKDSFLGKTSLPSRMTDEQIELLLEDLAQKGWKIIVLHCQPPLMVRILEQAVSMNLFGTGYGWFLSETAMTLDVDDLKRLPEGLLGLRGFYRNRTRGLLRAAAQTIHCAYSCMQECFGDILPSVPSVKPSFSSSSPSSSGLPPRDGSVGSPSGGVLTGESGSSSSSSFHPSSPLLPRSSQSLNSVLLSRRFRVSCEDPSRYFTTCVRYSPLCRQQESADKSSSLPSSSSSVLQSGSAFHLLTLVCKDGESKEKMWESVGYISSSGGGTDLKTVMWPGHPFFSPSSQSLRTYRVVTRPAKPFVFVDGPVRLEGDCFMKVPCLQLRNSSKEHVETAVEDFVSRNRRGDLDYSVYCCKGISLEILQRLSEDLNFQYVVYFVNDSNYGELSNTSNNHSWTGMVGDVISGSADLIVGAFSMTSYRMQAISFTEPYYQNEFSLVTRVDGRSPSIWAFLSPFSGEVWTCILLSSVVAGVATSSLEWFSPFGLNPRGRKRDKQYSLGSGLLMVWVLVTGHTINIKAPKSWPSKVIQNVWAGLAIFIMTSYTANLAAYLAGQSAVISFKGIYDSKLLQKRVSVIQSSAVEHLLEQINPDLFHKTRNSRVTSTADGIRQLQSGEIDVYLDDHQLLEYEVSRLDKDCKVQFVGKGFGSDGYAIGLPKKSWMRAALSDKILSYTDSGFIQELSRKYMTHSRCGHFLSGSAVQYGLEHTGGLFIILLSAVFVSVLLLCVEHLAYRFLIPWFRSRPQCSFWKTENMAFLSQRVHRVVRSEKLYSQKQTAQEMIKMVKQRDFTRIIQKNELQKRKVLPQKRVKTKAEMFQEITANIVSYHRQMKEPYLTDLDATDHPHEDGYITFDVVHDPSHGSHLQAPGAPFVEENHIGVNNLAYFSADEDRADSVIDESNSRSELTDEEEKPDEEQEEEEEDTFDASTEVSLPSPSKPPSSRSSGSSVSSPRRKTSTASSASGRERRERRSSAAVVGASASEPTSPEPRDGWELPVTGVSSSERPEPLRSAQRRRVSDVSPMRVPGSRAYKNNVRSRSQDFQNRDYFQRNLRLKDNRVKSTIRRHALSGYQSQVPADCLDECTLEALSKEDLLILWKRSELELQSKLQDVVTRNRRLALAIDYLTQQEEEEGDLVAKV